MRKNVMWIAAAGLGATVVLMGAAQSVGGKNQRPSSDETLLVAVKFNEGVWSAEPMSLLPCPSPSKPVSPPEQQLLFTAYDEKGEVLYQYGIMDPRLVLVEDPRELPEPLKQLDFVARLPFVHGLSKVELYVPAERQEPITSVEVSKVLAVYNEAGGSQQKAVCQVARDQVDAVNLPGFPTPPNGGGSTPPRVL